jgi:hypothetical protein
MSVAIGLGRRHRRRVTWAERMARRRRRKEGLVQARALLTDSTGPVFTWGEPGTLRRRVRVICEAVE